MTAISTAARRKRRLRLPVAAETFVRKVEPGKETRFAQVLGTDDEGRYILEDARQTDPETGDYAIFRLAPSELVRWEAVERSGGADGDE